MLEIWSGGAGGHRAFAVVASVVETIGAGPGGRQVLRFAVKPSRVRDGSRTIRVSPFVIRAGITNGQITTVAIRGFRTADQALAVAVPNLARMLAYQLRLRPRDPGARWRETEIFRYAGFPIQVTLRLSGRPVARIQGVAPIPERTARINGYAVAVTGTVVEAGRLVLGVAGEPPLAYSATAVVRLAARMLWMTVGHETLTVTITVTRVGVPRPPRRVR